MNFTGDYSDLDSSGTKSILDTPNRELSPTQGRWISPDPAGMATVDPTNPQSWNRYAYVVNTPLNLIDPSGLGPPVSVCGNEWCTAYNSGGGGVNYEFEYLGIPIVPMNSITQIGPNGQLQVWVPGTSSNISWCSPCGLDASGNPIFLMQTTTGGWSDVPAGGNSSGPLSWIQNGLNYLKTHPVFISVNEILAGQATVQWSTKTVCGNLGVGASVPPTKAVTLGVYNAGNMSNWTNVLSSWGYSFGANVGLGYQASTNSSGTIGGPTVSGVGLSGSYTYGGCMTVP